MKIKAVSQSTARFNIQRKPKKCWCLLRNISFGLFDQIKFQDFSKISVKSQNFSEPVGAMDNDAIISTCLVTKK